MGVYLCCRESSRHLSETHLVAVQIVFVKMSIAQHGLSQSPVDVSLGDL